jgi:AraC family transcriptional regulator
LFNDFVQGNSIQSDGKRELAKEDILSVPTQRAFARSRSSADLNSGDVNPPRRPQVSHSARVASVEVLRDVVIELIHAVNCVLNEELEAAVGSVERSAALLEVSARLPEFNHLTKIASPVARGGLAPWQARTVKTHIETHLDGSLRIKDLARVVQLSEFHFCRVFRVSFGHSPHSYVLQRRIERAQDLILSTRLTLGQIAFDCGFADQAHFTKMFRRLCGESPGEWRRIRAGVPLNGVAGMQS